MSELTDWFPPEVKPVHKGVYQTKGPFDIYGDEWFNHWDGAKWMLGSRNKFDAKKHHEIPSSIKDLSWRGIKK